MTPNVVKRHASRSPVGSRASKRPATSSPEEGELDDPSPPRPSSSSITSTLPPLPPSLPQKPVAALKAKVPFPFKKKHDSGINGLPSVVELGGHSISMTSVYERADEGDRRGGRDNDFKRKGRGHHQQQHQQRQGDHWEPGQSRGDHYAPRRDHRERERDRDRADRDRERDRERARSPSSLPPGSTLQVHTHSSYSPNRSRSPLSPHREKHRLPAPRTPEPSFSPMRNGYGGGGRDRDWGGRSLPGSGPRDRRYRDDDDDRYCSPALVLTIFV
ncbi:hypothetical protein BDN72DRAFT_498145 [Pluteus cervinus]|uniref:Uncharacterized protein n=1 Tax=Pluteus cervinus TaxID=181527 RepID=A0ACD3A4H8_9AGAR|nr:hypothetical protein BDN72DRAFT_498145 [Pluteus cervinus]